MSPSRLRARVVLLVLYAIVGLAFGLYVLIGAMLWTERDVPDALWLAAGGAATAIYGLLNNSKGGTEGGTSGPVEVRAPKDEPLAVKEADTPPLHLRRQPVGDVHKEPVA